MGDQEHHNAVYDPYCLPPFFAVFDPVLLNKGIGVRKDTGCGWKAHTVLPQIAGCFGRVPLKTRLHNAYVTTFSYVFVRSSELDEGS